MLKKFIERETEKGDLQVASFIDYEDTEEDESHDDWSIHPCPGWG